MEVLHGAGEVVFGHLPMCDGEAGCGDKLLEDVAGASNGFDTIVQEEDLAAAGEFALDGFADEAVIAFDELGGDGDAIFRGSVNGAHVARAGERGVQGAGDGRSGEGEDIGERAQFFEGFFMADAEALFFVNDDEAKIMERDIGGEKAVGADDNINFAGGECGDSLFLLAGMNEAGEDGDAHGVFGHAFGDSVPVLLGEDGGGDEDSGLFAGHDGFKGGAQGDFGFAEADVAANEAVHGAGGFHVLLNFGNGAGLVGGFGVGE